jgi:hypothetical protein
MSSLRPWSRGRFDFPFLKRDLVQIWINRFYPACPPALASRAGDPDGDGFNNEAEHFLGTDPMVANADRRLPIPRLEGEGAGAVRGGRMARATGSGRGCGLDEAPDVQDGPGLEPAPANSLRVGHPAVGSSCGEDPRDGKS